MKKLIVYILFLLFVFSSGLLIAQEEIKDNAYISFLAGNVDVDQTPDNENCVSIYVLLAGSLV